MTHTHTHTDNSWNFCVPLWFRLNFSAAPQVQTEECSALSAVIIRLVTSIFEKFDLQHFVNGKRNERNDNGFII